MKGNARENHALPCRPYIQFLSVACCVFAHVFHNYRNCRWHYLDLKSHEHVAEYMENEFHFIVKSFL